MNPAIEAEIARSIGEALEKTLPPRPKGLSLAINEYGYATLAKFALEPSLFWANIPVMLGPITEAEYLSCKKRNEDYEKGRLLYEQAKELGFYADCDCDD